MPSAATLRMPVKVVTFFLSFTFMMAGLGKLHPRMPIYPEMVEKAPSWLEALQLGKVGLTPDALRTAIGASEFASGLLLIATPAAAYVLAIIMSGAVYTHFMLDGGKITAEATPAAVLLGFIFLLIVLQGQLSAAQKSEQEEADKEEKRE